MEDETLITGLSILETGLTSVQPVLLLLGSVCATIGLFIVGSSLMELSAIQKSGNKPPVRLVKSLFIGAAMVSLQSVAEILSFSFIGGYYGPVMYDPIKPLEGSTMVKVFQSISIYLSAIGWYWLAKGLYTLHAGGMQQGQPYVGKAVWFMMISWALLNFYVFLNLVSMTFGGQPVGTEYFKQP